MAVENFSVVFVNLTPHAIVMRGEDGTDTTVAPSGAVARVSELPMVATRMLNGIRVLGRTGFGPVLDLPAPQEGVVFIVSGMVLDKVVGRNKDVIAPATGPSDGTIRNDKGHIVAVTALKE